MFKVKRTLIAILTFVLVSSIFMSTPVTVQAEAELEAPLKLDAAQSAVFPYTQSERYSASSNYTLKVNGIDIPVVKAYNDYDYANFSVSAGPVTYEVTILNTDKLHEYSISPKKLGIVPDKIEGRTLTFTTDQDEYLIITINNRTTRLVIAADPMETDVPNSSGEGIFNVTDSTYGVTTTGGPIGVVVRTEAMQRAIDNASSYGTAQGNGVQGIVYVPTGTYYIGNLVLRSNMALYMQPGATFVGTGKTADYKEHWFKNSMGRPATWWISTEFDSENIRIYGRGTIDGNGRALHDDKSTNGRGMINNLVVPIATSNFKMDGVIIRESAGWAVMPVRSNDMEFTNLKMFNSLGMGENDGIDIVESQDVVVRNSIGIALDDPYSTKTWQEDTDISSGVVPWPGNPEPVRNVLFEDSIAWTVCYGYKIGQGVMQDQSNIIFRDAVVYKAAVGFAIHHKYGTAAISNVTFENIDVEEISGQNDNNSAWMTMFTVNKYSGPITGVTVKNITVRDVGEGFAKIKGQEDALITDITFENVYMPGSSTPASTLYEMNFMDREFYSGVKIKPLQDKEPRQRTNLALNQPAVASSNDGAVDTASYAFDGTLATRFASKRGVDPSWLYVDLGESKKINEVKLYWEASYGKSYQIQVTDDDPSDETNWNDVYQTTNGKGGIETITFDETSARYVRMYGTERVTKYEYSIYEFEVYGPEEPVTGITLAETDLILELLDSKQLTTVISPTNASDKSVKWTTADANIASVDESGLVTAIGEGTTVITVTTIDGGYTAEIKVTVKAKVTEPIEQSPSPGPGTPPYNPSPSPSQPNVNRTTLQAFAEDLGGKLDAAVIGDKVGQYPVLAVETLRLAIEAAQKTINNPLVTQADIDAALTKVNQAYKEFESQKIIKEPVSIIFTDTEGTWAEQNINRAFEIGFISGYTDGTFRPAQQVKRAEFITMLLRALQLSTDGQADLVFADHSQIPAYAVPYVSAAISNQLIHGFEDGTFRPQAIITRTEAAVLAVRALGIDVDSTEAGTLQITDAGDIPAWAYPSIAVTIKAGLMEGRDGNYFAPRAELTRAEAVTLVLSILEAKK